MIIFAQLSSLFVKSLLEILAKVTLLVADCRDMGNVVATSWVLGIDYIYC
jgi:hypothetical protein